MSLEIHVKLNDFSGVRRAFAIAPKKMVSEIGKSVQHIIGRIERDAKRLAPVNKQTGGGNLRQSIRSQMFGQASGAVIVGANYAMYVHEGTRPHVIQVRTKRVLANKRTGQMFGKRVNHPGTKANPFLANAVEQNKEYIDEQINKAVTNALK